MAAAETAALPTDPDLAANLPNLPNLATDLSKLADLATDLSDLAADLSDLANSANLSDLANSANLSDLTSAAKLAAATEISLGGRKWEIPNLSAAEWIAAIVILVASIWLIVVRLTASAAP